MRQTELDSAATTTKSAAGRFDRPSVAKARYRAYKPSILLAAVCTAWTAHGATINVFPVDDNVGIGTASPAAPLEINETTLNQSNAANGAALIRPLKRITQNGNFYTIGLLSDPLISIDGGLDDTGYLIGSRLYGLRRLSATNDLGTLSALYGVDVAFGHEGTVDRRTRFVAGLDLRPQYEGGTIDEAYALRIANATRGAEVRSEWAIYQADPESQNAFLGNVGIGVDVPEHELDVAGTVHAERMLGPWANADEGILRLGNIQVLWGRYQSTTSGTPRQINFQHAFADSNYALTLTAQHNSAVNQSSGRYTTVHAKSPTHAVIQSYGAVDNDPGFRSAVGGTYIAIGKFETNEQCGAGAQRSIACSAATAPSREAPHRQTASEPLVKRERALDQGTDLVSVQ